MVLGNHGLTTWEHVSHTREYNRIECLFLTVLQKVGKRREWAQASNSQFKIFINNLKNFLSEKQNKTNNLTQIFISWSFMAGISKKQTQSLILWVIEFQLKLNPQFIRVSSVKASKLLGKNEVLIVGIGAGGEILRKL